METTSATTIITTTALELNSTTPVCVTWRVRFRTKNFSSANWRQALHAQANEAFWPRESCVPIILLDADRSVARSSLNHDQSRPNCWPMRSVWIAVFASQPSRP